MIKHYLSGILLIIASMVSSQAFAVLINDAGVVGTIWHCDHIVTNNCDNSNTTTEIAMGNYLLGLAANDSAQFDATGNGGTETYTTGINDYNGTLTDAFKQDGGALTGWTGYEYVMGKYDGQNAGYILFHVADYQAAFGDLLPATSSPIWANNQEQGYQLSHWTGFNGTTTDVPEPATALLLGLGLLGFGMSKKRKA